MLSFSMHSHRVLWLCAAATAHAHDFHCDHDSAQHPDQYVISPQPYAEQPHLRGLSTVSWEPIRLITREVPGALDTLSPAARTFLTSELLPSAIAWIESALSVVPVSGKLHASRGCSSLFPGTPPVCAATRSNTCGAQPDGGNAPIPDDLLDEQRVCTSCYGDSCSDTNSVCSTLPAGAGVEGDFVLMLSAVNTAACGGATLAYASTCQRDQLDRPIFGDVNFCPSKVRGWGETSGSEVGVRGRSW